MIPKCYCCSPSLAQLETAEHLFCGGNFAQAIWAKFGGLFGISTHGLQYKHVLIQWWKLRTVNIMASFINKVMSILVT